MKTNRNCPLFEEKDAKFPGNFSNNNNNEKREKEITNKDEKNYLNNNNNNLNNFNNNSNNNLNSSYGNNPFVAIEGNKLRISSKMIQIKEEEEKAKEKLTISIPKQIIKDQQLAQLNDLLDPFEYLKRQKTKRGRRTKSQAQVYLNNLLENILNVIKGNINSFAFRKPVSKKVFIFFLFIYFLSIYLFSYLFY